MIRIVCPHCHAPLSAEELEQVSISDRLSLVCPECFMVLVSEPDTGSTNPRGACD